MSEPTFLLVGEHIDLLETVLAILDFREERTFPEGIPMFVQASSVDKAIEMPRPYGKLPRLRLLNVFCIHLWSLWSPHQSCCHHPQGWRHC